MVLGFPVLKEHLPRAQVGDLITAFSLRVCRSYLLSSAKGISALTDSLVALHVYLGYIRRDYPNIQLVGTASVAEVRGRELKVAWTDGTCHVVTGQASADVFPTGSVPARGLAGGPNRLLPGTYQGRLAPGQGCFLATSDWLATNDLQATAEAAKQTLATAVTDLADGTRPERSDWFADQARRQGAPGLLIAIPTPVSNRQADQANNTRFVPPAHPDATRVQARPDALPAGRMKESVPEAAAVPEAMDFEMSEPKVILASAELETPAVLRSPGAEADTNPGGNRERRPAPATVLQSALDTRGHGLNAGSGWFRGGRRFLRSAGQRLKVWFGEAFPDPNAEPQAGTEPAAIVEPSTESPREAVVSPHSAPAAAPNPGKSVALPNFQEIHHALQERQSRRRIPKSWSAMLLLCLLITVPAATYFAYRINEPVGSQDDPVALALIQQQVEKADALLGREQYEAAQQQLQQARELAQSIQETQGPSPGLNALQLKILELWDDAFQRIPLLGLTEPLLTFGRDHPPALMAVNFQDLYVLASDRRTVTKYRLDSLRRKEGGSPQEILSQDTVIDGVTVGRIVDMAFQPTKTAHSDKPSLYLIDDDRHLFQYNDTDLISHVTLGSRNAWINPVQIDFYSNRLYVADGGHGQIWRYNLNQAVVQEEPWLPEPIDLSSAVGMHVGDNIWLLFDNNSVVSLGRQDSGNPANIQLPFAVHGAVGFNSRFVDLEADTDQNNYMLLVDSGRGSILVLDPNTGAFRHQLVPPNGMEEAFDGLLDVFVHRDTMYILTAHALFEHAFNP
ncbi:MAG: hypothetical protein F4Y37_06030 [Caldilineaceae bacterium SB0664_bin_22]|nr:hypothetical protein [Caldilineaceae bacterium SB0664_bin_22]MYC61315.1 hypothetical protein [Caldilineaceae bacterium SB0661_bin_34]